MKTIIFALFTAPLFAQTVPPPLPPPSSNPAVQQLQSSIVALQMSGTGLQDLTLTPSIAVGNPECWHGYITNGTAK